MSATASARSLHARRVAFTGRLATLARSEAEALVRRLGGLPVDDVNRTTSLLVVGMAGWALLPDGRASRKLARAEELAAAGTGIEIVSELDFRERCGLDARDPAADGRGTASAGQVAQLLGVTPETLRRWEQLSLVRSSDGQYDFHDIVTLRTIARLIADGVRPETIARSWRQLARLLPAAERPLAQLRLVQDRELAAELGDTLLATDGQMLLNFEPAPASIRLAASAAPEEPGSAEAWFERGAELEGAEQLAPAAEAYRRALALRPAFAEARFNLGNVLRDLGDDAGAGEAYAAALRDDPHLSAAAYNLADLCERVDDLEGAAGWLRKAVAADPGFADAHFNLAHVCERLGRQAEAARHWSAYLRLDPRGPWALQARMRLAACSA